MRVRLGDVCEKGTSNIAQKDLENCNGDYPIYGASGFIKNIDFYHQEKPYIAVIKDGAGVGRIMKLPAKTSVIGTMQYILPKDNIYISYLAFAMEYMNLSKYYTGATIPHIYFKDYKKEEINLPPLEEQRKIADILDKVTDLIEKRKQQIDKLDLLVKAKFIEMFGDPVENPKQWSSLMLREVCKTIFGGGTPLKNQPKYYTGNIPWISPKDMKSLIINDSIDHITEEAIQNSSTNLIPKKSVLMVIRSGILKHKLPVAINNVMVSINQDMKAFLPNDVITSEYLMYYFLSIVKEILSGVRGVTADNIDFKVFQKRLILVPPIGLQQDFSDFVNQTEKQKIKINESLEKLEMLKKSLMQQYFM